MKITFDPAKRAITLADRGLDFLDSRRVFRGPTLTQRDDRFDYGEVRFQTYGVLDGRLVMVVWTTRGAARHIISMRKCNDREKTKIGNKLGKG